MGLVFDSRTKAICDYELKTQQSPDIIDCIEWRNSQLEPARV